MRMKKRKVRQQQRDQRRLALMSQAVRKKADIDMSPLMRLSFPGSAPSTDYAAGAGEAVFGGHLHEVEPSSIDGSLFQ
jgi:hypothetical protein